MRQAFTHGGLSLAALAATAILAGCASAELEARKAAEVEAARIAAEIAARTPPPVDLDPALADSAATYIAFVREVQAIEGGFASPEAVQAALRQTASYDPDQLSRGLVAYAAIVALQSPDFVASVQRYSVNPTARAELAAAIAADHRQASYLDGADRAAGLVTETLREDIKALGRAADSVENDAYAIQAAHDPRQSWGRTEVLDREGRLAQAKSLSAQGMAPAPTEAQRLYAAARMGAGVAVTQGDSRQPPYSAVVSRALALAALSVLNAAGPEARQLTSSLQSEPVSERCLAMSKLNFYQCLAASRPSYEDIFCVGRHAIRDLSSCVAGASMPAAIVRVSDLTPTGPAAPPPPVNVVTAPLEAPPPPPAARTPSIPAQPSGQTPPRTPARPPVTPTERLNTQPATSPGG